MSNLNQKSKAEKVIELYKQGKTRREIAKTVHMSLGDIGAIIKKFTEEEAHNYNVQNSIVSEETQAIRLFFEGKIPIEVKIELDMTTAEVERLYKEYWRLRGLYQLYTYYENVIKENLPSFLRLYKRIREVGISDEVIIQALRNIRDLPTLRMTCQMTRKELGNLEDSKETLVSEIRDLKKSKASAQTLLNSNLDEIQRLSSIMNMKMSRIEKLEVLFKVNRTTHNGEGPDLI